MSLEHLLLGMLREPASGYDLKIAFRDGCRHFWSAELSQIYPALERMERRGWLKSRREPSPRGPARRVYRRTPAGTRQLHRWLRAEPVMGTERFAYIGQLVFLGELADPAQTRRFLEALRARLRAYQELLEKVEGDWRLTHPDYPRDLDVREFHECLSVRMGIRSLGAKVAACDEGLALLRQRRCQEEADA
jgi:PadR family transcriptional regulator AphA